MLAALENTNVLRLTCLRPEAGPPIPQVIVVCDRCEGNETGPRKSHNPEIIARMFRGRGWEIDDRCKSAICPTCKEKKSMSSVTTLPSKGAIHCTVKVVRLLMENFGSEVGAYAAGWSDAKIAEATGAKVDFVAATREQEFGPLKPPDELVEMKAALAKLAAKIDADYAALAEMVAKERDAAKSLVAQQVSLVDRACNKATGRSA